MVTFGRDVELDDPPDVDADGVPAEVRGGQLEPAARGRRRSRSISSVSRDGVGHRPAEETGHRRGAGRGRAAQPDELEDRAVADVAGARLRARSRGSTARPPTGGAARDEHSSDPASRMPYVVPLRHIIVTMLDPCDLLGPQRSATSPRPWPG